MKNTILICLIVILQSLPLTSNEWAGLQEKGWRSEVKERLETIIREKAGHHLPIVFDLDETILARDIADATLAILVRDNIIQKERIPDCLFPTFRLGDRLVSLDQATDLTEYGRWFQKSTLHQAEDIAPNICCYAWVAQILTGLTCQDVVEATAKAYQDGQGSADLGQYPGDSKIWITPEKTFCLVPFIRPEMVELIAAFLMHDYDVWVISGSPVLVARWIILEQLNKLMTTQGCPRGITEDHVIGISTLLQDEEGNFYKDYPLVSNDPNYAQLNPKTLSQYRFTQHLTPPVTGYSGKVAAIVERIGHFPYFGAGDSLNDAPFLRLCTHKLWIARLEETALQKAAIDYMKTHNKDSWLVQPVLSKKAPCFISDPSMLPQLLKGPEELAQANISLKLLKINRKIEESNERN